MESDTRLPDVGRLKDGAKLLIPFCNDEIQTQAACVDFYHMLTQTLDDAVHCFQDGCVSNVYCGHATLETLLRTAAGRL